MCFLSKIFGYVPAEERKGISLSGKPCWEISGVKGLPAFLRAVLNLVPSDSVLYLEDRYAPRKLRSYLQERVARNTCKVQMGTIWPRPECFHMQITKENLEGLAELAERFAAPEVATHLHIYKEGDILLEWYDAFFDPLFVSKKIPEFRIREFCQKLGAKYEECEER